MARGFKKSLATALAERDLAVSFEEDATSSNPFQRRVVIVRQSSRETADEDEQDEDSDDGEDGDEPLTSVNTAFLDRMVRSLARSNARQSAAAAARVPTVSLATRRAQAEAQIRSIAASVGLRVEIHAIEDEIATAVDSAVAPTMALPLGTSRLQPPAASASAPAPAAPPPSRLFSRALAGTRLALSASGTGDAAAAASAATRRKRNMDEAEATNAKQPRCDDGDGGRGGGKGDAMKGSPGLKGAVTSPVKGGGRSSGSRSSGGRSKGGGDSGGRPERVVTIERSR